MPWYIALGWEVLKLVVPVIRDFINRPKDERKPAVPTFITHVKKGLGEREKI